SIHGSPNGDSATLKLAPGERMAALTLWGNGVGTRCGGVRILTSEGQTFDHGKDTGGQEAYDMDVGSGICVGLNGRSGSEMDCLGFIFLNGKVTNVVISSIQYNPDISGSKQGISQVTLEQVDYTNPPDSGMDVNWSFNNTASRTTSNTFTQTSSTQYGVSTSITIKSELFGTGIENTNTFPWQKTQGTEYASTTSTTQSLSWNLSGVLKPGKIIRAQATCQQGIASVNYTSTVTVQLDNGYTSTYTEPGVFNNVVYTQATARTAPIANNGPDNRRLVVHNPELHKS
ncbi:hypothetical protein P171DRAFT_365956, partial [Karstenula rhodostoma CBS 690.94]